MNHFTLSLTGFYLVFPFNYREFERNCCVEWIYFTLFHFPIQLQSVSALYSVVNREWHSLQAVSGFLK